MFTGIIEEIGRIVKIEHITGGRKIKIKAVDLLNDISLGDSIAVNGVCLTVTKMDDSCVWVDAVGETLEKTTLYSLTEHSFVNLEKALRLSDRLGGHIVQGHVNGVGEITQIKRRGNNYYLEILLPSTMDKYIVEEGSITVNGISLTVARINESRIGISIIPHTWANTTFAYVKIGQKVNIETDILAKYIEKIIKHKNTKDKFSEKWFQEIGY